MHALKYWYAFVHKEMLDIWGTRYISPTMTITEQSFYLQTTPCRGCFNKLSVTRDAQPQAIKRG